MKWQVPCPAVVALPLLAASFLAPGEAALLLGTRSAALEQAGMSAEAKSSQSLQEVASAEADARRFWATEWSSLGDQLVRLAVVAGGESVAETSATSDPKGVGRAPATLPALNPSPKTTADLAPALAMLKGLYEDGKARIASLNTREKDSKSKFAEIEARHNATLARIEASFANHKLSAEFHANETRDEERLWGYWRGVRMRQNRQYRTGLRIQHATLQKVKTMIDMYEKTMSGKADSKEVENRLKKLAPPEIVFVQEERRSVARFCREAIAELNEAVRDVAGH